MKRSRPHAYLSGGMEYARNEGGDWRREMESWLSDNLGHRVFNPNVESEKFFSRQVPHVDIRKLKFENVVQFSRLIRRVVDRDSREIASRSDYVVCYWDESAQRGAGTKGELTIAKYFRKPVYFVSSMGLQDVPGWVLGCVTEFFQSFDQLKPFLLNKYARSGRR